MSRLLAYLRLMRFDKPIGILLLLWPSLWALWISSGGHPPLKILSIFIIGVIIMRAAGCIINDFADRHFDRHVTRTKNRPLTSGKIKPAFALALFVILLLIALLLVLMLNRLTLYLAVVGALLSIIYPFTKRFFHAPQLILSLAFAWSIPMAFAAILNSVPWIAWLLFAATACWIFAYDTEYALVDIDDDIKVGIKSTAILFGTQVIRVVMLLQLLMLSGLILLGYYLRLDAWYYLSLLVSCGLFAYQHRLIKTAKPECCFKAFLNNHWVGLVIFAGLALALAY
ncbi:MAG: 4-hydroxybenzoate octaprenyltransferase [Gammaproteobacteria bacterium]|nr:4-hydroxybenzoate octaprenyltransferase [Gammaproteobacteria bacterium]